MPGCSEVSLAAVTIPIVAMNTVETLQSDLVPALQLSTCEGSEKRFM